LTACKSALFEAAIASGADGVNGVGEPAGVESADKLKDVAGG